MEFLKSLTAEETTASIVSSSTATATYQEPLRMLSCPLAALHAAVVMEMLCDELEVLSGTVAAPNPELRSAMSVILCKEHRSKFTTHPKSGKEPQKFSLVQNYCTVIPRRMMESLKETHYWSLDDLQNVMAESKIKIDTPSGKYQRERTFIHMVADNALRELLRKGTFHRLNMVIEAEKDTLRRFWTICLTMPKKLAYMKELREKLRQVREEKLLRLRELDQDIFNLNDQLLEQSARIQLETKLVEKQVLMIVKRFKRRHRQVVNGNHAALHLWQRKLVQEARVHYAIVTYLKEQLKKVEILLLYWSEKYERDLPLIVTAIEEMQEARQRDLKRMSYIRIMITRHEPIVIEERRLKEIQFQKQRTKEREEWAAVKIQSLWRGTMVRKKLGPYNPNYKGGKGKADKDGGKGKDGKKKKK
ncbi:hypothetical protein EGW08_014303 [Elysia chlorotica]|uniref:Dynein regulatory complex protein 9 n=1 Tax=Elysia chlorotica TaxID=188477 RepID=A0A3S1B1Z4_ELYCH|nr:hypothetical protein EGW08_014303 [Elysia chlorotica]